MQTIQTSTGILHLKQKTCLERALNAVFNLPINIKQCDRCIFADKCNLENYNRTLYKKAIAGELN